MAQPQNTICNACHFLVEKVNKATTILTQDYEHQPQRRREPEYWRSLLRMALSLAVVGALVYAVVFLARHQPMNRIRRNDYNAKSFYTPLLPGPLNSSQEFSVMTCPCFTQSLIWTGFIDFWLIYKERNEYRNGTLDRLCDEFPSNDSKYSICVKGRAAILSADDYDETTQIKSANLLNPWELYYSVITQINTNSKMGLRFYEFLKSSDAASYNYTIFIQTLLYSMIYQQFEKISSTTEDYWNSSRKFVDGNFNASDFSTEYALGMSIHWDKYAVGCNPTFCDSAYKYTMPLKVLTAMSQVGGFLGLSLVIVRVLLWRALTKMLFCGPQNPPAT